METSSICIVMLVVLGIVLMETGYVSELFGVNNSVYELDYSYEENYDYGGNNVVEVFRETITTSKVPSTVPSNAQGNSIETTGEGWKLGMLPSEYSEKPAKLCRISHLNSLWILFRILAEREVTEEMLFRIMKQ